MSGQATSVLLLLIVIPQIVIPHPQCLDFKPPFRSDPPLRTCSQYTDFGCCNQEQDEYLGRALEVLLISAPQPGVAARCSQSLQDILCLRCSPYAAHLYDSEGDGRASILPGLCRPNCETFYRNCNYAIPQLIEINRNLNMNTGTASNANNNDTFNIRPNDVQAPQQFCDEVRIGDMDYCFPNLTTNPIFRNELITSSSSSEGCLCLEQFAEGLRNPVIFRVFPDGTGRIAVGEQLGVVHVYSQNKVRITDSFMDLQENVLTSNWQGDERGFLGLEFHPDFATNRKFYCYMSVRTGRQQKVRISEFKVDRTNPNKANRSSERVILEVDQPYSNHNGGEILFGTDGYLYLFLGDGGSAGDPGNRAQNKNTLLGKVLRIDVNQAGNSTMPYGIPPDNPFVNDNGPRPEIYAYGIRNIWRCDMDKGDPITGENRGRIICGDVGQDREEEIDIIMSGGNYGWNAREGYRCYRNNLCGRIGPEILPVFSYNHTVGKSVTGGHVYRGCLSPALSGRYIFGDYVYGRIFYLEENTQATPGTPWKATEISMCGSDVCFNGLTNSYEPNILSFGKDQDGEVYVLTTQGAVTSRASGKIYKLVDPRRRGDPTKCPSYKPDNIPDLPTLPTTKASVKTSPSIINGSTGAKNHFPHYITITTCVLIPVMKCLTHFI